jgi:hypothetical protein
MATYRCLIRNRSDAVVKMDRAEHGDDDRAVEWASGLIIELPDDHRCEVWQGKRIVCKFPEN